MDSIDSNKNIEKSSKTGPSKPKRPKRSKVSPPTKKTKSQRIFMPESTNIGNDSSKQLMHAKHKKNHHKKSTGKNAQQKQKQNLRMSILQASKDVDEEMENDVETYPGNQIPSLSTINTTFPHDVVRCAFCGLPANWFPGLGDLYGPYRPTYLDVIDRYDKACKKLGCIYDKLETHAIDSKPPNIQVIFLYANSLDLVLNLYVYIVLGPLS